MASREPPVERHYSTDQARELLALAHVNDVLRLITDRKLRALKRQVRAEKGFRWIIPDSALKTYIAGLESNMDQPAIATGDAAPPPKPSRRSALRDVKSFI